MSRHFFLALVLCISILLSSCSNGAENSSGDRDQGSGQEAPAVHVIEGTIVQAEGNRRLITSYSEHDGAPQIDAYWFTISEKTELQNSKGQAIPSNNLTVGMRAEAWSTGAIRESYPAQADAAKIIVHADEQAAPEGMIGQTDAVRAALLSQTGSASAMAVKAASLDEERGYWNIELVRHDNIDSPISIRINTSSGLVSPNPVAENKAFRVFAPAPGTEASPTFTVEGEARVFEASFSWRLEDGQNVLAEGHEMANGGAPAWGHFRFNVSYKNASQSNMSLILFTYSAKDGSVENELIIPLKAL